MVLLAKKHTLFKVLQGPCLGQTNIPYPLNFFLLMKSLFSQVAPLGKRGHPKNDMRSKLRFKIQVPRSNRLFLWTGP